METQKINQEESFQKGSENLSEASLKELTEWLSEEVIDTQLQNLEQKTSQNIETMNQVAETKEKLGFFKKATMKIKNRWSKKQDKKDETTTPQEESTKQEGTPKQEQQTTQQEAVSQKKDEEKKENKKQTPLQQLSSQKKDEEKKIDELYQEKSANIAAADQQIKNEKKWVKKEEKIEKKKDKAMQEKELDAMVQRHQKELWDLEHAHTASLQEKNKQRDSLEDTIKQLEEERTLKLKSADKGEKKQIRAEYKKQINDLEEQQKVIQQEIKQEEKAYKIAVKKLKQKQEEEIEALEKTFDQMDEATKQKFKKIKVDLKEKEKQIALAKKQLRKDKKNEKKELALWYKTQRNTARNTTPSTTTNKNYSREKKSSYTSWKNYRRQKSGNKYGNWYSSYAFNWNDTYSTNNTERNKIITSSKSNTSLDKFLSSDVVFQRDISSLKENAKIQHHLQSIASWEQWGDADEITPIYADINQEIKVQLLLYNLDALQKLFPKIAIDYEKCTIDPTSLSMHHEITYNQLKTPLFIDGNTGEIRMKDYIEKTNNQNIFLWNSSSLKNIQEWLIQATTLSEEDILSFQSVEDMQTKIQNKIATYLKKEAVDQTPKEQIIYELEKQSFAYTMRNILDKKDKTKGIYTAKVDAFIKLVSRWEKEKPPLSLDQLKWINAIITSPELSAFFGYTGEESKWIDITEFLWDISFFTRSAELWPKNVLQFFSALKQMATSRVAADIEEWLITLQSLIPKSSPALVGTEPWCMYSYKDKKLTKNS